MIATKAAPLPDFPDDPRKWDGWSKYHSANSYERLCLDPRANPSKEQIEQHCTALLLWWKKKAPLRSQPSNPLTQLLGRGLDESSGYLIQARMALLDPARRAEIDKELAAQAQEEALAEFAKYVAFSIAGGVLTADAEANLTEYGQRNGLRDEQVVSCIEEELRRTKARRAAPIVAATPEKMAPAVCDAKAEEEFVRILRLGEVDMWSATDSVRGILANVARNLGIDDERADFVIDDYLEEKELALAQHPIVPATSSTKPAPSAQPVYTVISKFEPSQLPANFVDPTGAPMLLVPAGSFIMGSDAMDAAPNEQPLTLVKLSTFYMARHPVTNAQYERFDPSHRQKRMRGAGDDHPVVHVTSLDAVKYCKWLSLCDEKKYRLPTEAEWEYAARGTDGRKYPWGHHDRLGDLANFADASTTFPWRDLHVNDGYPESSPVGAFPRGASPFGLEDMAGNVWEWCLDFFQPLSGTPKENPRGPTAGPKRVYRGGSWKSRFSNLRVTARGSNEPNYSCNDLGFRIVCECGSGESRWESRIANPDANSQKAKAETDAERVIRFEESDATHDDDVGSGREA